jgi:hypothetical protein
VSAFVPLQPLPHVPLFAQLVLVKEAKASLTTLPELYRAMALQMARYPPPQNERLPFLNDAWRAIAKVRFVLVSKLL